MSTGRVDVAVMTLLSVVTLGIFFLIWVYKAMKEYRQLSGREGQQMDQYYWATIICLGASVVLTALTGVLGILTAIAAIVVYALFLNELIKDRDTIAARLGVTGLAGSGLLITLAVVGNALAFTLIGLVVWIGLEIWFCIVFFQSHNKVAEALSRSAE